MEDERDLFNIGPDEAKNPGKAGPISGLAIALSIVGAVVGAPIGMQLGLEAGEHPPLGTLCFGFMLGGFGGAVVGALLDYVMTNPTNTTQAIKKVNRYKGIIIIVALMVVAAGLTWAFRLNPASEQHMLLQYRVGIRDFTELSLSAATLVGVDLNEAILDDANLDKAILSGANLSGASLVGVKMGGAVLFQVDLHGADLRTADLTGADIRGADLRGADLREANLQGADLRGTDLREADLNKAKLRDAVYNAETSWSSGFEPEQSGTVRMP